MTEDEEDIEAGDEAVLTTHGVEVEVVTTQIMVADPTLRSKAVDLTVDSRVVDHKALAAGEFIRTAIEDKAGGRGEVRVTRDKVVVPSSKCSGAATEVVVVEASRKEDTATRADLYHHNIAAPYFLFIELAL